MTYDDGVDNPRSDMMKERDSIRGIVGVASPAWCQFPGLLDRVTDAVAQAIAAHTEAALKDYQAALDGTHYHHKMFEPLCTHCRAALREVIDEH